MQPRPKTISTEWLFQASDLRYFYVFRMLFSHPKLASGLLSIRSFWWQTLLMALFLCLAGAFLLTLNKVPEYGKDILKGTKFVQNTVHSVEFTPGNIRWEEKFDEALPASTSLEHCQLDIVESWSDFQPPKNPTRHNGIVLCHDGIGYWDRDTDGTLDVCQLILPGNRIPNISEKIILNEANLPKNIRFIFMVLFGALFASYLMMLLESLCLTVFVVSVAWLFIGRFKTLRAFPRFLILSFNFVFPPFLTALVWQISGIPGGFDNLFCITFLLYLLYSALEGRNGMLRPA